MWNLGMGRREDIGSRSDNRTHSSHDCGCLVKASGGLLMLILKVNVVDVVVDDKCRRNKENGIRRMGPLL